MRQTISLLVLSIFHLHSLRRKRTLFWLRKRFFYQLFNLHSASSHISQTQFHLHLTPDLECFSRHCAIWITIDAPKISTFCTVAKCGGFNAWRICGNNGRERDRDICMQKKKKWTVYSLGYWMGASTVQTLSLH